MVFRQPGLEALESPQPRQQQGQPHEQQLLFKQGVVFSAGAVEGHRWKTGKTVLDELQWRSQEQSNTRTLSLPLTWLG